jgi:hypothetical protein
MCLDRHINEPGYLIPYFRLTLVARHMFVYVFSSHTTRCIEYVCNATRKKVFTLLAYRFFLSISIGWT